MKKLICIIILCGFLTGCEMQTNSIQEIQPEPSEIVTSETNQTAPTEPETEVETFPELSAEIPEEAVIKKTEIRFSNDKGKIEYTGIYYLDSHENPLLYMMADLETGKPVPHKNISYQYDENGNVIHQSEQQSVLRVNEEEVYAPHLETTYEYDDSGQCLRSVETTTLSKGKQCQRINEYTYDQYGNTMTHRDTRLDMESGEITYETYYDDTDCDYDKDGNILVCREYLQDWREELKLYRTVSNTYDENHHCLTSEIIFDDYGGFEGNPYSVTHRYEYDENGNQILDEEIRCQEPDEIVHRTISSYQYDELNRQTHYEKQLIESEGTDSNVILQYVNYEYETLS